MVARAAVLLRGGLAAASILAVGAEKIMVAHGYTEEESPENAGSQPGNAS